MLIWYIIVTIINYVACKFFMTTAEMKLLA